MTHPRPRPQTPTAARKGAAAQAWVWWKPVLTWLLLWVMTLDVATSPLHTHEHDGVPPPFETGMVWAGGQATHVEIHAPLSDHHHAGHPTLALRASDRGLSVDTADTHSPDAERLPAVPAHTAPALTVPRLRASTLTLPAAPPAPPPLHRSLPPAGRAPPVSV